MSSAAEFSEQVEWETSVVNEFGAARVRKLLTRNGERLEIAGRPERAVVAAMAKRDELRGLLNAYKAKAARLGTVV